jgi:hypothetical protein
MYPLFSPLLPFLYRLHTHQCAGTQAKKPLYLSIRNTGRPALDCNPLILHRTVTPHYIAVHRSGLSATQGIDDVLRVKGLAEPGTTSITTTDRTLRDSLVPGPTFEASTSKP